MPAVLKIYFLSVLLLAAFVFETLADKGFTPSQSIRKYGDPVGRAASSNIQILFFDTPDSKITETFTPEGICVESVREYKPVEKRRADPEPVRPILRTVREIREKMKVNSFRKPLKTSESVKRMPYGSTHFLNASRNSKSGISTFSKMMRRLGPEAVVICVISVLMAIVIVIFKGKIPTPQTEVSSREQVRSFYDSIRQKYNDPLGRKKKT